MKGHPEVVAKEDKPSILMCFIHHTFNKLRGKQSLFKFF